MVYSLGTCLWWQCLVLDHRPTGRGFSGWRVTHPTLELCLSATRTSGIICRHTCLFLQIDISDDKACVLFKSVLPRANPEASPRRSGVTKPQPQLTISSIHPVQFCSINKWLGGSGTSMEVIHLSLQNPVYLCIRNSFPLFPLNQHKLNSEFPTWLRWREVWLHPSWRVGMKHPSSQVLTGIGGASLCLDNRGRDLCSVSQSPQWSDSQGPLKVNSLPSWAWPWVHVQPWETSPAFSLLGSTELVPPNEI